MTADSTVQPHPYLSEQYIRDRYDETLRLANREIAPIVGVPHVPVVATWQKWYRARLLQTVSFQILPPSRMGSRKSNSWTIVPKGLGGWAIEAAPGSWTFFCDVNPWPSVGGRGTLHMGPHGLEIDYATEQSVRCFPSVATDHWKYQDMMADHVVGDGVLPVWPSDG